ncbi:hypothetical protein BCR34DRAFT_582039 [Clohesyomyces aquaticus]|uniref:Uncharacterized protein n=1 Tax=Clohesyomyces aquaticus TaxID=1231657 RepID=A0A1Y2ABD2_9PLEO|nr:hypothetical protein BCR34DRAFT_582039 [Clohesyomyces aquaticus]
MGIILSTASDEHGHSYLPSYEIVEIQSRSDTNIRMLERYYATGEGRFDLERKKHQDKAERRRKRLHPEPYAGEDDWSTDRIEINLSYPDAARVPDVIHIVEGSEDGSRSETGTLEWEERGKRYPAVKHSGGLSRREHQRSMPKHERNGEKESGPDNFGKEVSMAELTREAHEEMREYSVHHGPRGERVLGLQCFFVSSGKLCVSGRFRYRLGCSDGEFAELINDTYKKMGYDYRYLFFRLLSPSKISFIKFVKASRSRMLFVCMALTLQQFEFGTLKNQQGHLKAEWTVTSKRNIIPSKSKTAMLWLERRLKKKKKDLGREDFWTRKLDDMVVENAVIKVHLFETLNVDMIYGVLWLSVGASVVFAIAYGVVSKDHDWSTAFSGAGWVIAAVALFAAILGAKSWFGGVDVEVDGLELADDDVDVEDRILETEDRILNTEEKILRKMEELGRVAPNPRRRLVPDSSPENPSLDAAEVLAGGGRGGMMLGEAPRKCGLIDNGHFSGEGNKTWRSLAALSRRRQLGYRSK